MTKKQWEMVQALARCTFTPGCWDKRFVRSMHALGKGKPLSEGMKAWLPALYYKYRRQIKGGPPAREGRYTKASVM